MQRLIILTIIWIGGWGIQSALAAGTPANTVISTQATAQYQVGAATLTQSSNPLTTTVAELLDVDVTWQDSTPVVVHPEDINQILTFSVTNTGNGNESFTLAGSGVVSGDDFDPTVAAIYLDANADSLFDANTDTLYTAGVNDPALAPDAAITLFVLSNIPANLTDGTSGLCQVSATALTGTGLPGDGLSGMGEGGTDAVFGASGASASITGAYAISNAHLAVTKSATVVDPRGGDLATTDAVITYQIQIEVTGSGTARSVVFTDPIPAETTYQPNSLQLNGTLLSDLQDSDAGDVGVTTDNVVTVNLGDLAESSPTQTITFEVTIN